MSSTQFHRHIGRDGRVTFKIGDQALDPTNRKEQIAAAHLLKKYEHPGNNAVAGAQWVNWLGVRPSNADGYTRLMQAWGMFGRDYDIADVAKLIGPTLEKVLGDPGLVVEQTGEPDLLIVRVEHNPRHVRLYLKAGELDCEKYEDWLAGAQALANPEIRPPAIDTDDIAFRLWADWSRQSKNHAMSEADLAITWDKHKRENALSPLILVPEGTGKTRVADVPDPDQSPRSRIGQILDIHTEQAGSLTGYNFQLYSAENSGEPAVSGFTYVVQTLPELQQQLADLVETLITERIGQQQVLKARGATVLDCHQLGLLSDDDMANHMADCLMVVLGKPVGAKAAKSIMLTAMDYANGADVVSAATPIPVGMLPGRGTKWRHTGGQEYEVVGYANLDSTNAKYPVTVIYQGLANRKSWSRPAHDWDRSFTLIKD